MSIRIALAAVITVSCAYGATPERDDARIVDHHDGPPATHDAPVLHDAPIDHDATFADAPPPCKPPNIIHGDGHHNPTMDCASSCHGHGFSISGTLFAADLVTPASNATITIVDALDNSQDIIVSTNGNFFSYLPAIPPLRVSASLCPSTQPMIDHPAAGACNAVGCHEPGGVQGVMHL
jgi:hypothetical protein